MGVPFASSRRFAGLPGGSEQWVRYRVLYTAPGGAEVASEWCEAPSCRVIGAAPVRVEHVGHQQFSARCAGAVVMAPPALRVEVEVDGGTRACRVMTVAPDADATFEGLTHMAVHTFRVRGVNAVGPGSWSEPSRPQGHPGKKVRASSQPVALLGVLWGGGGGGGGGGGWQVGLMGGDAVLCSHVGMTGVGGGVGCILRVIRARVLVTTGGAHAPYESVWAVKGGCNGLWRRCWR
jgi:hypothetical protein